MPLSDPPALPASSWLVELIHGRHPVQRESIRRLMRIVVLHLVSCLLLWSGVLAGLTPAWSTGVVMAYGSVGGVVFYAAMRSGLSLRYADPSLAYPLLLFSASTVALSYILIDEARGAALQLLCLLLAFEMDRLHWRPLLKVSLYTIGTLSGASLIRWVIVPQTVQVNVEVYNLLMAGVLLPVAIIVATEVRRLYVLQFEQREELGRTLAQLNDLSTRDALTGLVNRRQMLVLLDQEQKRQHRTGQSFCVAILDIDWFKRINDGHGHGTGDAVLKAFSSLASSVLNEADTLARWGGEEFLLLMPASDESHAMRVLALVRETIVGHDWGRLAPDLKVSFSAGLCEHSASDTLQRTLEQADRALYRAKANGRDRAEVANEADAVAPLHMQNDPADTTSVQLDALPCKAPQDSAALQCSSDETRSEQRRSPSIQPVKVEPRRGLVQGLSDLIFSRSPDMHDNLRMSVLAMVLYAIWIAVFYWYAIPSGQMEPNLGMWLIRIDLFAMLAFYPLIRSGWSARFRDAQLALPQVLVACFTCMVGYAAAPVLRPSVMHLMCVIQVFAMVSLYPRGSRISGAGAVLLLLLTIATMAWIAPPHFNVRLEALKILMTCFIVGRLSMLAYDYSQVREKVASEKSELARAVAQVQELVIRDALTGLFNRKHLQDLLERERERFSRTGHLSCVALIDLDHFKRINDTHGHQVGDEVLQGFAKAAQAVLRETDIIGRWGGEEFLVLMSDSAPAKAGFIGMERLRKHFASVSPCASAPHVRATFSCGITQIDPEEAITKALERADRALYKAKAAGRNQCMIADTVTSASASGAEAMASPA